MPLVLREAFPISRPARQIATRKLFFAFLTLAICLCVAQAQAQSADRIPQSFDPTPAVVLANHHPLWASPANDLGALEASQTIDNMTLVLARSPERQKAFDQFVEDQQNPASPNYHHWLTPVEIGTQFGLSDDDIAAVSAWLKSQGLHVNWVAPSKIFIAFGGTAPSIGRAFGTEMHAYNVHGEQRISVASDPKLPIALAPAIQAVRGLYTLQEKPQHASRVETSYKPNLTIPTNSGTEYFLAPADFDVIYDVNQSYSGSGVTIGIVGESRTDMADFTSFKSLTATHFPDPTEVIPTAFGGVDPGPAFTAPPSCETTNPPTCSSAINGQIDAQGEATLDVQRTGGVAQGSNLLLVIASGASGGIGDAAQYLTESTPVPAQVMSISFGACESADGKSDVDFWDNVYETGAAEGISTFVSSGDSGAAGCDANFAKPPASPAPISPNALCSSSYVTCVGGTEFNDAVNSSTYWNSNEDPTSASALGYIPEGAWNEPGNATNGFDVAATGGGVSAYIATPTWQTGTGVSSARAGRYTPDVAFSAAGHDGYFGCLSAIQSGSCVSTSQGTPFVAFEGTSAAAPAMAGVAALLDQATGGFQGNLAPTIYSMAASDPSAFHDVTVQSSGVASCGVATPSMCNNSIPGPGSLTTGAEAGYLVQTGYDEATGWGSLDVNNFLTNYLTATGKDRPNIDVAATSPTTDANPTITVGQALTVSVTVSGGAGDPAPTGSVSLSAAFLGVGTGGSYTSSPATLNSGSVSITVPAGSLPPGDYSITATYVPDSNSASTYISDSNEIFVEINPLLTPYMLLSQSASNITVTQTLTVGVTVESDAGFSIPTGKVKLTSGSYSTAAETLTGGAYSFTIPAGALPDGPDTLTVTYKPDTAGAEVYTTSTATATVSVTNPALANPAVMVTPSATLITVLQALPVTVTVQAAGGNPTPTGSVKLTSGTFVSSATTLTGGSATISVPAGALGVGNVTLSVIYVPDTSGGTYYNYATGSGSVTVDPVQAETITVTPSATSITTSQSLTVTVTVVGAAGFSSPTGSTFLTISNYMSPTATLVNGSATIVLPPGSLSPGDQSIIATYTADANSSLIYGEGGSSLPIYVQVTQPPTPGIGMSATNVTLSPGATATSTVTVSPDNGFTGNVILSSAIVAKPPGAVDLPSLTFGSSSPVDITGTSNGTAILTITTTAPTSAGLERPHGTERWYATEGATLACIFLLAIPARRRAWRNFIGLAVLALVASAVMACGGGAGGGGGGGGGVGNPGTTAGTYTISVVGTSGSVGEGTAFTLTVQ